MFVCVCRGGGVYLCTAINLAILQRRRYDCHAKKNAIHSFTPSLIKHMFIEYLLCARSCVRFWKLMVNQNKVMEVTIS